MKLKRYDLHVGPRPGKKSRAMLEALKPSHILTLLAVREQVRPIEKIAGDIGAEWRHFPIDGGKLDALERVSLRELFDLISNIETTSERARIYLHCSAGIHRTGFIAYILLRRDGLTRDEALSALKTEREVTFEQVGMERIDFAEEIFLRTPLNPT